MKQGHHKHAGGVLRRLVVVSAIALPACGTEGNPVAPGPDASLSPGTMSATIDGVPWSGTIRVAHNDGLNRLIVTAEDSGLTGFTVSAPYRVGTYSVNSERATIVHNARSPLLETWLPESGTVIVSVLTDTIARGRFSGTLVPVFGRGIKVVSDGAFHARLPTER